MMVMALIGFTGVGEPDGLLLTDFQSRMLSWVVVNDNVMGGRSEGGFEIEKGILVFTGATNTDGGGFSSIRSRPEKLGLGGRSAIRLRVRGDGRTYTFRLDTGNSRASYWANFETKKGEWVEVRLPFDSFLPRWRGSLLDLPPPDPAEVAGVGLMIYDKRDGEFRLEVDWIRADAPFALADMKWNRRPLVVFAPKSDDPRLQAQLDSVRKAQAGFAERDMALVVVAPGHSLSRAECATLRRDLEVEDQAFAVLLVGKDGGVKRRDAEPVSMVEVFAQIDRMPMRQAEMRGERKE